MSPPTPFFDPAACAAIVARSIAVGIELTERLRDLPENSPRNPAADYNLLARGVRQSILLLERLATLSSERDARRTAARAAIIRAVDDAILKHASGRSPAALRAELLERLDRLETELDRRPAADLASELCRDLHLVAPMERHFYRRRTPADIEALQALAEQPPGQAPAPQLTPEPEPEPEEPEPELARPAPPPQRRRAALSHPSLILPAGLDSLHRPEAAARDQR